MKNIISHIRNKISASYKAEKQKWEEQHGGDYNAYIKQGLTTLAILFVVLLVLGLNDLYETHKLSTYGVETYSTVYGVQYMIKRSEFLTKCRFYVNGKEYSAKYAINRPLQYGDTLGVLYYPENPKINQLLVPDSLKY